jgi:hypothetical protein
LTGFTSFGSATHPASQLHTVLDLGAEIVVGGAVSKPELDSPWRFFAAKLDADLGAARWGSVYSATDDDDELVDTGTAYHAKATPDGALMLWGSYTGVIGLGHAVKASLADGHSACSSAPLDIEMNSLSVVVQTYPIAATPDVLSDARSTAVAAEASEEAWNVPDVESMCRSGE